MLFLFRVADLDAPRVGVGVVIVVMLEAAATREKDSCCLVPDPWVARFGLV